LVDGSDWHDDGGIDCEYYESNSNCESWGDSYAYEGMTANQVCCACGGGAMNIAQSNAFNLESSGSDDHIWGVGTGMWYIISTIIILVIAACFLYIMKSHIKTIDDIESSRQYSHRRSVDMNASMESMLTPQPIAPSFAEDDDDYLVNISEKSIHPTHYQKRTPKTAELLKLQGIAPSSEIQTIGGEVLDHDIQEELFQTGERIEV